jgi:hypothetical protein
MKKSQLKQIIKEEIVKDKKIKGYASKVHNAVANFKKTMKECGYDV